MANEDTWDDSDSLESWEKEENVPQKENEDDEEEEEESQSSQWDESESDDKAPVDNNDNYSSEEDSFVEVTEPEKQLEIWQPPDEAEVWDEEKLDANQFTYSSAHQLPGIIPGDWSSVEENLQNLCKEEDPKEGEEMRFKTVVGSLYTLCRPIWETVGEDTHVAFIVDLDSLLLDLVEAPYINFTHGLQVLPIIHLLERRLNELQNSGRTPMIVAFDCMKSIWPQNRADIFLLREIILLHCEGLQETQVFRFPNFWCDEWLRTVREQLPAFAVVAAPNLKPTRESGNDAFRPHSHYLLEAYIVYLNFCQEMPVVLSSTINYKSNAMRGHKLECLLEAKTFCRTFFGSLHGVKDVPSIESPYKDTPLNEDIWGKICKLSTDPVEQIILYMCASYMSETNDKGYCGLLILAHYLQKNVVPLEARRFVLPDQSHKRLMNFLQFTYSQAMTALQTFEKELDQLNLEFLISHIQVHRTSPLRGIVDLLDGRFLHRIAQSKSFLSYPEGTGLSDKQLTEVKEIWGKLCTITGNKLDFFPILERDDLMTRTETDEDRLNMLQREKPKAVVGISNTLIEEIFGDTYKELDSKELVAANVREKASAFWTKTENRKDGWKNSKLVHDGIHVHPQPKTTAEKRAAHNFLAFVEKYSRSLMPGKIVLRDVIVAKANETLQQGSEKKDIGKGKGKRNDKKKKKQKGGRGKGRKGRKVDVRELARLEVENKNRLAKIEKTHNLINLLSATIKADEDGLGLRIKRLETAFESESDADSALPGLMQVRAWCEQRALRSKSYTDYRHCVKLWQVTQDIFRRFGNSLNAEQIKSMQIGLLKMGYVPAARALAEEFVKTANTQYNFDKIFVPSEKVEVQINSPSSYPKFQLEYGGHLMVRSVDSAYDPRVTGFYPDKWQRDLLDVVDGRGSALVVAPTSSGKTFVSWYAMKRTLEHNKATKRAKDRRRIVYVCPTKALSQQAAAEVYTKYGDVFGIFTEDYDHKVLESEVTVVVPETFETLLTSHEREDYINSIDYVIFDEVHCLGEGSGGEVWERLIMLVRCPFIALSATVGEPAVFQNWLSRVGKPFALSKANEGHLKEEVVLIHHHLRWSDLQKYIYLPKSYLEDGAYDNGNLFIGCHKRNFGWKSACMEFHPAAAVAMGMGLDQRDGFPEHLNFSPNDSLKLYEAMVSEAEGYPELIESLKDVHPHSYFEPLVITKKEARNWEIDLKDVLWLWISGQSKEEPVKPAAKPNSRKNSPKIVAPEKPKKATLSRSYVDVARKCLNHLAELPKRRIEAVEKNCFEQQKDPYSFGFVVDHITKLLLDLERMNRMPVLIFCLDQRQCELLLKRICENLAKAEENDKGKKMTKEDLIEERKKDKKIQKELKKIEKEIEALKKVKAVRTRDRAGKDNRVDNTEQLEALEDKKNRLLGLEQGDDTFDERFTFVKTGERLTEDDMYFWKRRCMRRSGIYAGGNHIHIKCLDRGIGIHHEKLGGQYKQLVETLFRAKHLKVVISTATLAMGVNMPARSVIFAGDHPDLNPLRYRQMMGRAGRRGYDNIGHVTFLGIRPRKIAYLMTSQLTSLTGHYPVTPGMCMKVCAQFETFSNKNECTEAMSNLIVPPFDARVDTDLTEQLRRNLLCTLQTLYHFDLIDRSGRTKGLGGVASALMRYEPQNLVFVKVVESGIFHEIARKYKPGDKKSQFAVAKKILLILLHIFHDQINIPPESAVNKQLEICEVVLPPIEKVSSKTQSRVDQINREVFSLYEHFCQTIGTKSTEQFRKLRTQLPLSKIDLQKPPLSPNGNEKTLIKQLADNAIETQCVSLFTALSDPEDSFDSQRAIMETGRDDFIFNRSSIPTTREVDARGRPLRKNSFAYDYYCHDDFNVLLRNNDMTDKVCWDSLKSVQLLLKNLVTALKSISGLDQKIAAEEARNRRIANQNEQDFYIKVSDRRGVYKGRRLLCDAWTGEVIRPLGRGEKASEVLSVEEDESMLDAVVQSFQFLAKDFKHKFKQAGKAKA